MEFKIRASGCGQIMTNPRSKSDLLSKTAQTFCQEWLISKLFDRHKEISSKYMDKGLIVEDQAIDLYSELTGKFFIKNEQYFENEFCCGTPDIISDIIADVKSVWSPFTLPIFETEVPANYFFQLQVYMHLTGKTESELVYVLCDTPLHLIEAETYSYCRRTGYNFTDVFDGFVKNMTYSDIPKEKRIKIFTIDYDPATIERIEGRVKTCREYINQLI